MLPDTSREAPATKPSNWVAQGHAKLLYPLLTVLNVALLLLLYYYLRRILCSKRPSRGGSGTPAAGADSDTGDSSADTSPSESAHGARPADPAALSALPLFVQAAAGEGEAAGNPECAVCLGELAPGETGRLLPRCGHRFHADCVDAWFRSHSTCPICRSATAAPAPVVEPKPPGSDEAV